MNGEEVGSEIVLSDQAPVEITGTVRFDPAVEDVAFIELIQNGDVVERFSRVAGAPQIAFSTERTVDEASWFAVRGYGYRLRENTFPQPIMFGSLKPTANVHSAPIYITIEGRPALTKSGRTKRVARSWLARLVDLETVLAEDNLESLAQRGSAPEDFDGVPLATLRKNRGALLEEVRVARGFFERLAR